MTHSRSFDGPFPLPNFSHSFIWSEATFKTLMGFRAGLNGKESGQSSSGEAGGDSRHWTNAAFPKGDW
jgi:hypothetical protein